MEDRGGYTKCPAFEGSSSLRKKKVCAVLLLIKTYIMNFNESVNMSFDIIA